MQKRSITTSHALPLGGRLVLGGLAASLLIAAAVSITGCAQQAPTEPTQSAPAETTAPSSNASITPDVTELKIEDLKVGTGQTAKAGDTITANYTGWLADGTKFDSSYDSGQPISFVLGAGKVIPGWDQGLVGMKVGGKRKLIIPPALGYGAGGYPPTIPPNATLVFEVELVSIP